MKLPKELQKSNSRKPEHLTEKKAVQEMLKNFKLEFLRIKDRFGDNRKVSFLQIGDKGHFSPLIPIAHINEKPAQCFWTDEFIEIYFGYGVINNYFRYYDFKLSQYKQLFKELSAHEYGHILSTNTSYDLYPKHIANIIKTGEYTSNEVEMEMDYSREEEINQSLKKIDVLTLSLTFREFLANYMVYKKISKKPPSMLLLTNCIGIASQISSLRRSFISPKYKSYDKLCFLVECSSNNYIFHKWEMLSKNLIKSQIECTLEFAYKLNSIFNSIAKNYPSYKSQIEKIYEITLILDQIDYKNIVLKNIINRFSLEILNSFND